MRVVPPAALAVPLALVLGCRSAPEPEKNYDAPLPPGQTALRKITDPARIPDLTAACENTAGLRVAVERSLHYLGKPSSREHFPSCGITHARVVASLRAFLDLLDVDPTARQMNAYLRTKFDVYTSVGCDGNGTVLFTGYYTPVFEASLKRTEQFRYPLYKPPAGLVKLPNGDPAKPMPSRRAIEMGNLYAGNELVWMADRFEAYLVHVQGSARMRLRDGREITVGYAANNGHPYKSVRAELVRGGKIGPQAGLPALIRYFRGHPDEVTRYTWRNPRFVFFGRVPEGNPLGCLNEPVLAMRSVATDKSIFPRAALVFLSATLPRRIGASIRPARYAGFALDQDAGGAIRAPGRCDVYMGEGAEAGELAGRAKHEGRLYYLFLKPQTR
jgi:membrane-bound lytic murein transglycosylase A